MGPHSTAAHEMVPVKGTARSTGGANRGRPADLLNPLHYPVEAQCPCGRPIRAEDFYADWQHAEDDPPG